MKISNLNSMNFGKVYALYGTKQQVTSTCRQICNDIASKNPSIEILNATNIYQNNRGNGVLTKAAHEGKSVCFVITGKEDCDKLRFMQHGWGSVNGVSHHIDKGIDLDKISKKEISEIKNSALDVDETDGNSVLTCGEGVFSNAYGDLLAGGMNESDAYMQARAIEEETLEYCPRHE